MNNSPSSSPSFNVLWVHVDGSLAVFDGCVVVVQLREGGGAVAVEHLVRVVDLNRPEIMVGKVFLRSNFSKPLGKNNKKYTCY